jgi:adenine-specific DNA-methyltransferase
MGRYNDVFTDLPEERYLGSVEYGYRKKLGQFFTPMFVADFMTEWVVRSAGNSILDPALGLGVFFRSIVKNYPDRVREFRFTGYEIDGKMVEVAKSVLSDIGVDVEILNRDYLIEDWDRKYDGIVCNPPYLKFHNYGSRDVLLEMFRVKLGVELSGFTNIYVLFMLKSILQLREGGRAAYIVPSEFLNSNYGRSVKEYIKKSGMLRFVIVVDFGINVFEDAVTTSSILLFANDEYSEEVEFINVKSFNELDLVRSYVLSYPVAKGKGKVVKISELDEARKWRVYYQELNSNKYRNLVPLSKYARVSRGIATGSNEFFMFSESKRVKYGIRMEFLMPCLARASYARKHFFTNEDFVELKRADKPVYLLNATDLSDDNLREYISLGEREGVHKRYLTSHRMPWYLVENRLPAPILATVFNREGIRFVKNDAGVCNLTAFHCIYLNAGAVAKIDLLMAYLVTDVAKKIFDDYRREYGRGLRKFEPGDLSDALVVDMEKIDSAQEKEILGLFYEFREGELKGKSVESVRNRLDEIFLGILRG